ncbi:MAG TPA: zinc ribbon domain-containing protein [Thermodesulfovibrionales bacterium]|nr:zinc ribbon domain-containing protein [Thermodesulfovibrionales bacterium]
MPIYEYACNACNETFSLLQRVGSSERDSICPRCGSDKVRKKLSAFSCSSGGSGSFSSFPSGGHGGGG